MRDSESRKDRERSRDRNSRERRRIKERSRPHSRPRESRRDRDRRDRDYESRKSSHKNSKISSKKYTRHSRSSSHSSSSSTSSSSYSSNSSKDSDSSHRSHKSSSYNAKTRSSSDSNSRPPATMPNKPTTHIVVKNIDLRNEGTQKALESIEEDRFEQKTFYSTRDREAPVTDKVIIDLNAETVTISKPLYTNNETAESKSLIHPRFLADDDLRQEKWIRKLFAYRQKYHEFDD